MKEFAAKWNDEGEIHPLICHMIDSGVVAQGLWQHGLTKDARQKISAWLNLSMEDAVRLIGFWTALHDIGKATPSFQLKCEPAVVKLKAAGYSFSPITKLEIRHHSLLSVWILKDLKDHLQVTPQKAFNNFLLGIGGHHGVFPSHSEILATTYKAANLGDLAWHAARLELLEAVRAIFKPPAQVNLQLSTTDSNAFFGVLSGFFVTADWLASQSQYFIYEPAFESVEQYWLTSQQRANDALQISGWIGWKPDHSDRSFADLFPFQPNPLQKKVIELAESAREPFLMILEAPTGSGKTEAALFVADRLISQAGLRGCYVAMPTQATSNQMFERIEKYLRNRFPEQSINLHLVHGNALIHTDYKKLLVSAISDDEGTHSGVNAMAWFTPRKRTLLAPFGVGTVDQTFFSVLQTRHFFLRLFGLFRKVIIFDEVHAYDVYMVEIFKRLLAWLRAIGTAVIILSATLPQKNRHELLAAYDSGLMNDDNPVDFPRVSFNENKSIHTDCIGVFESRYIHIEHINHQADTIIAQLQNHLVEGGCAAVICNTVGRAQRVYQEVTGAGIFDPDEVILFHSRFPYFWREAREKRVIKAFGKLDSTPALPRRGVVIATQVIEQSLDLDFDLLITDMAPVDLLIQRIGRLHRHSQSPYPPNRPVGLSQPKCFICMPELGEDGLAKFGSDRYVYAEYILQRSYFVMRKINTLWLPKDTDDLIEAVYAPPPIAGLSDAQQTKIDGLFQKMSRKDDSLTTAAFNRLIGDVDYSNLMGSGHIELDEDNPKTHRDLQALTRDTHPTVQLVCMVEQDDGRIHLLDGNVGFDLTQPPRGALLEHALRSMVTVSHYEVVKHFMEQTPPKAWRDIAPLRYAHSLIFRDGRCAINEKRTVALHPDLGLYITQE